MSQNETVSQNETLYQNETVSQNEICLNLKRLKMGIFKTRNFSKKRNRECLESWTALRRFATLFFDSLEILFSLQTHKPHPIRHRFDTHVFQLNCQI